MKYILEDRRTQDNYVVRLQQIRFNVPTDDADGAYLGFTDDEVIIQNLTVFPYNFSNWDAIKWGLGGLVRTRKAPGWFSSRVYPGSRVR